MSQALLVLMVRLLLILNGNLWKNQETQLSSISLSNVTYTSGGTFMGTTFDALSDTQIRAILTVTPYSNN